MRRLPGFTIIEMLVVLLLIAILAGIVLAVGSQVQQTSKRALTQTELRNLQGALDKYIHKTGQTPKSMPEFLENYQLLHSYTAGGTTEIRANAVSDLPKNMVVSGTFVTGQQMVVEVLDAFGHPIQYMPPSGGSLTYYPVVTGGSLLPSPVPTTLVYVPLSSTPPPSLQDSHAPYFYSFGPLGPTASSTAGYTFSYAP